MAKISSSGGVATTRALWLLAALAALATCTVTEQDTTFRLPGCEDSPYHYTEEVQAIAKINYTITKLYLFRCNFTSITADQLKWYPNLSEFALNSTNITQIEVGAFDSLAKLKDIDLADNRIIGRNLPEDLFRNSSFKYRIRLLDFSLNNMAETPAKLLVGMNISILFLIGCSLREFPSFVKRPVFHEMKQLQMSFNFISKLDDPDTFTNIVDLVELNLASNSIDYLHADLLKPLNVIQTIILSNNKIRFIPDGFFRNKTSLKTVYLINNVIEYLPADAFLGSRVKLLSISGNRLTHLPINFISELQKAGGNLRLFGFHRNPWQCACLNELLVDLKKSRVSYKREIQVFDGRHPVCVTDDAFKCHRLDTHQNLHDNSLKEECKWINHEWITAKLQEWE